MRKNSSVLKIKVSKLAKHSTVSKIIDMVQNATETKAKSEKFIVMADRFPLQYFAKYYGIEYLAAFSGCSSLFEIELPETLKVIGSAAFYDCDSLLEIVLPKTLKEIGSQAFRYCRSLQEIEIPEGVREIESETFSSCTGLKKVILPKSVKKMKVFCVNI